MLGGVNLNELVSIVVPVFNMGDSIEKCVKSICKQTYSNLEIILVDDGSKDDSLEKCNKLAEMDKRISVYHTENNGSGPARNYGIECASGKYILFPDADDYLDTEAVEKLLKATNNGMYDIVVFGYHIKNLKGKDIGNKVFSVFKTNGKDVRNDYSDYMGSSSKFGIQGAPWNKFFSMEIIRKHKVRFPALRRHQDEGFIARYMCYVQNVIFISEILYTHYVNDLKKEWDKYPVGYLDAVIGLNEERKHNILIWNSKDHITHEMVQREYISNVIKALELSFSPKFKFNKKQRIQWIRDSISKTNLLKVNRPSILGKYQIIVLRLLDKNRFIFFYNLLRFKIYIEKIGMLQLVKSTIRH